MGNISALYQIFGGKWKTHVLQTAAQLKDMQNMAPNCQDYYAMHYWPADGAERCIVVWRGSSELVVRFYAADLGGYFVPAYDFPIDNEIWIGLRPNNTKGSEEYDTFTWWVHDKTADVYEEVTRDTPVTWSAESMDVALEMVVENTPNTKKRGACNLYCLDKNQDDVKLSECFRWLQWDWPPIINQHDEIYTENGYKAECIQWKTITGIAADLVIDEIWNVGNKIRYLVKNIGNATADSTHTKLVVDGVEKEQKAEASLDPTESRESEFAHVWACDNIYDAVEVTADCNNEIDEQREDNNTMTKNLYCEKADMKIEDIWIVGNAIHYRVKNDGSAMTNTSHTKLEVDGVVKETKEEPELNAHQSRESSFTFNWTCSGTSDTIKVTADCNGEVDENTEGNNSREENFNCEETEMTLNIDSDPQGLEVLIDTHVVGVTPVETVVTCQEHDIMVRIGDIVEAPCLNIESIWTVENVIHYAIKNVGDSTADISHTKLNVDGVERERRAEYGLDAGESRNGTFTYSWVCSGDSDTIEVIADCNNEVSESNEGNNSLEITKTCPSGECSGIDLTPIEIFTQYGQIAYKIKNQGTVAAPSIYSRHIVYLQNAGSSLWKYQGFNRAGSHAVGAIKTFRSRVLWPSSGTKIKVLANSTNAYIECNTENNEMIVTA